MLIEQPVGHNNINRRRASAARVTSVCVVVCLCVCLSIYQQLFSHYMSDTNGCRTTRAWKLKEQFCWNDSVRVRETVTVTDGIVWPNPFLIIVLCFCLFCFALFVPFFHLLVRDNKRISKFCTMSLVSYTLLLACVQLAFQLCTCVTINVWGCRNVISYYTLFTYCLQ